LANYRTLGSDGRSVVATQAGLRLIAYLLALVYFAVIYRTRLRSLVTATAVTFVGLLISLSILRNEGLPMRRIMLYAGVIGLILGEATWALNYWRANAVTVGVLLMLLFYVLIGIVREYVRSAINRQVVVEFLAVAVLGIWIVLRLGPS